MRKATSKEIITIANQLHDAGEFTSVMGFAIDAYGEAVHKVTLETDHNFDDGSENRFLTGVNAYDKDGKKLSYDFSLPFWQDEKKNSYYQSVWRCESFADAAQKGYIHDDLPEVDLSQFDSIWNIEYYRNDGPDKDIPTLWIEGSL